MDTKATMWVLTYRNIVPGRSKTARQAAAPNGTHRSLHHVATISGQDKPTHGMNLCTARYVPLHAQVRSAHAKGTCSTHQAQHDRMATSNTQLLQDSHMPSRESLVRILVREWPWECLDRALKR